MQVESVLAGCPAFLKPQASTRRDRALAPLHHAAPSRPGRSKRQRTERLHYCAPDWRSPAAANHGPSRQTRVGHAYDLQRVHGMFGCFKVVYMYSGQVRYTYTS